MLVLFCWYALESRDQFYSTAGKTWRLQNC